MAILRSPVLDYRQEQQDDPALKLPSSDRAARFAHLHRHVQGVRQAHESDSR